MATTMGFIGTEFPDLSLPGLNDPAQVSLRSLFNRPTCVFVWASW